MRHSKFAVFATRFFHGGASIRRHRVSFTRIVTAIALLTLLRPADAQVSFPMLMSLKPIAVQVGTTTECEVSSRYTMLGTYRVTVGGTGVTAEAIPPELPEPKPGEKPKDVTKLKLKFVVAAEAIPGVREFRLLTPNGASTIGQVVVVRDSIVSENASNDTVATAQAFTLPATLCGAFEKVEDVDYWKFSADAGQFVTFHVQCQRTQDKIHDLQFHADPILFLRDAKGGLVAMSDNRFFADPFVAHRFEQAGEYTLEIRDVRYHGNSEWPYCIEVNSRPFVTGAFPKAIKPGIETRVELSGYGLPDAPTGTVLIPESMEKGMISFPVKIGGQVSNPIGFLVTDLPVTIEPTGDNNSIANATVTEVPAVIAGRIETESDLDCYVFQAKKGDKFAFEVIARRQMSNLDSYLRILSDQGNSVREIDDGRFGRLTHADSWIENWEAPTDGKFYVEIRDGLLRGGAGFEYALQITHPSPSFDLEMDTDKTQLTPGTYGTIFVRAVRKNGFAGEVQLHIDGLPAGVTATCGRILAGKGIDGCISLYAPPELKPIASDVRIWGTATHELPGVPTTSGTGAPVVTEKAILQLSANAIPYQEYYAPGGGRGHFPVETHSVAVGVSADLLAVNVSQTDIRLKPGESKKIEVTLNRAQGVKGNVSLDFLYRHLDTVYGNSLPAGVIMDGSQCKLLLTGDDSSGYITLKADKTAPPVERQLTSVMASFAINFVVKAPYFSPPIFVSVEKE